jgi:hypothetical protein
MPRLSKAARLMREANDDKKRETLAYDRTGKSGQALRTDYR